MALSKTTSPDDRTRFLRLSLVIIDELTPVLQDVLTNEISPSQIFNTVKQNKKLFQKLGPDQIDKVSKAQTQGYKYFDITLLYTLLRNLCPNIPEPTKGWGNSKMSGQNETNLGDDIERIRLIRNNVCGHISVVSISETEFKEYWSTIFDICKRLDVMLGKKYVQRLQNAESCTIDSVRENMYMNKMKDLIESEKSTRELLQRVIKEKGDDMKTISYTDLSSQETVRIETKNPEKKKFGEALTETSINILNDMVNSIHEKSPESDIEQLYESIEYFIGEDNEESPRLAYDPFFEELRKRIKAYANLQKGNKMKIMARFLRFIMRLKKKYSALLVSYEGSLLLKLTFTSERGYDLYKNDLERGEIGKQILEVLLFPPYLASFHLKAEDLVVYLNDQKLTQEQEPKYSIKNPHIYDRELIQCDLCKTELGQFQCDNCHIKLCNACSIEHLKSVDFKEKHQIVKFQKSILFYPPCTFHDEEKCEFYCDQCDIPICITCIASDQHLGHTMLKIWQILDKRKEKVIKEKNELMDTILPAYQDIAFGLENMIQQLEKEYGYISADITKHGDDWHREINALVLTLKIELTEMKAEQMQNLYKNLREINDKISEIRHKINSAAVLLESDDLSELLTNISTLDKYRKLPQNLMPQLPEFIPGVIPTIQEMYSLFGTISQGEFTSEKQGYGIMVAERWDTRSQDEFTSEKQGYGIMAAERWDTRSQDEFTSEKQGYGIMAAEKLGTGSPDEFTSEKQGYGIMAAERWDTRSPDEFTSEKQGYGIMAAEKLGTGSLDEFTSEKQGYGIMAAERWDTRSPDEFTSKKQGYGIMAAEKLGTGSPDEFTSEKQGYVIMAAEKLGTGSPDEFTSEKQGYGIMAAERWDTRSPDEFTSEKQGYGIMTTEKLGTRSPEEFTAKEHGHGIMPAKKSSTRSPSEFISEHGYGSMTGKKSSQAGSSPTVKRLLDEPEIITTINTECIYLNDVACLGVEELWTSGSDSTMRLFSMYQGSLLKSIKAKSGKPPINITVTKHGHLVYTDRFDRTVNIVKNEEIETVIRLRSWKPQGVCSTISGDLLVIMDSGDIEQSKVIHYSGSTDLEKQAIQFDDEGKRLYTYGYIKYITENKNLDICVSDCGGGAVVVVNHVGRFRFRYTGHTPAPRGKSFNPQGITTDRQNHILTADFSNNCVHIIDQDGQFLHYILQTINPWGLCTDTNDNLFIVQRSYDQVKKIKYLH